MLEKLRLDAVRHGSLYKAGPSKGSLRRQRRQNRQSNLVNSNFVQEAVRSRFSGCFGTRKRSTANYFVKWMASTSFLPAEAAGTLPDRERPYSRQPSGQRKQSTSVDKLWQKYSLFWRFLEYREGTQGRWNLMESSWISQTNTTLPEWFRRGRSLLTWGIWRWASLGENVWRGGEDVSKRLPQSPSMPCYARLCPAIPGYALVVTCISDCTGTSIWRDSDGWQKRSDSRRFQRGAANWSPCTWTSLFARPRPENGL